MSIQNAPNDISASQIDGLTPPVAAFYVLGLEYAIAVMFRLPCAMLINELADQQFWIMVNHPPVGVTVIDFLQVLAPVTLGNVIGGGVLVALVYWFVYMRADG